jgi:hypothetical protein
MDLDLIIISIPCATIKENNLQAFTFVPTYIVMHHAQWKKKKDANHKLQNLHTKRKTKNIISIHSHTNLFTFLIIFSFAPFILFHPPYFHWHLLDNIIAKFLATYHQP